MFNKNSDIRELSKKPEWTEVIKLYSGLFEDDNDRAGLIYDLIDINPDLAVECKLNSVKEEVGIIKKLRKSLIYNTRGFKDPKVFCNSLISLLKIYEPKDLLELVKIKRRYVKRLCLIIISNNYSVIWELINLFVNEKKYNQRLLWFIEFIPNKSLYILSEREEIIYKNVCTHLIEQKRHFHLRRLRNLIDK